MKTGEYRFSTDPAQFDADDQALQLTLAGLQETVDWQLRESIPVIDTCSPDEQQALIDRVYPYLKFELDTSPHIWEGMPLAASGLGGILVADMAGTVTGIQNMTPGDSVVGMVDDIRAYPVPSLRSMVEAADDPVVTIFERVFSSVVILQDTQFHQTKPDGGTTVHDLSRFYVVVPTIYGMHTTMADIAL